MRSALELLTLNNNKEALKASIATITRMYIRFANEGLKYKATPIPRAIKKTIMLGGTVFGRLLG